MYPNFKHFSHKDQDSLKQELTKKLLFAGRSRLRSRTRYASLASAIVFAVGISSWFLLKPNENDELINFADQYLTEPDFHLQKNIELQTPEGKTFFLSDSASIDYEKNKKLYVNGRAIADLNSNSSDYNVLTVPYGQLAQLTLSDGTQVWLNAGSQLVYPHSFKEKDRKVFLSGEAIFDVTHQENHPFYVVSQQSTTKVLGTVFDVNAYPENKISSTTLMRGKVQVTYINPSLFSKNKSVTITPGMQAVIDKQNNILNASKVDVNKTMAWRNGYYEFSKEPLSNVLERLSKFYNIKFEIEDSQYLSGTYSGSFKLNENVETIINWLELSTGKTFDYDASSKTVKIK